MFAYIIETIKKHIGGDAGGEIQSSPKSGREKVFYKTNSANQNPTAGTAVAQTIWVGMTTQQIVQDFGPALTKQYQGNREIWTYLHLMSKSTKTLIAIENGRVVNWQDLPVNAYMPQRRSPGA